MTLDSGQEGWIGSPTYYLANFLPKKIQNEPRGDGGTDNLFSVKKRRTLYRCMVSVSWPNVIVISGRSRISQTGVPTPKVGGGGTNLLFWPIFPKLPENEKNGLGLVPSSPFGSVNGFIRLWKPYKRYSQRLAVSCCDCAILRQHDCPTPQVIVHIVVVPVVLPGGRNVSSGEGPAVRANLATSDHSGQATEAETCGCPHVHSELLKNSLILGQNQFL